MSNSILLPRLLLLYGTAPLYDPVERVLQATLVMIESKLHDFIVLFSTSHANLKLLILELRSFPTQ